MRALFLIVLLFLVSCGSSTEPEPVSKDNLASPELVAFNESAAEAHSTSLELAELVQGPGGIAERTEATRTLPLTTVAEIKAWRAERDALRAQLEVASQKSAKFALELGSVERNRRAFLEQQALYFPALADEGVNNPQALSTIRQPLVVAALAIATLSIGAYRFLKGFGELADNTQRMVYTTAEGSPESRAAVIKLLKDKGVEVSDSATAQEVIDLFDEQPRDVRRTITTQVEAWNEDQFAGGNDEAADALDRFEEARDEVPDIANEGGAFAVTQTVTFVQSVTGGVGNVVGGVPGAGVDLVLTATEMNPTDIVQRNVTVYVTTGEKEDLPTETSPTPPALALETIEKAAEGDSTINPDEVVDAAVALIQEVADGLRAAFGPTVQIAQRFAITGGTLTEEAQDNGTFKQEVALPLPYFTEGEVAEVVIAREGIAPQEVVDHLLRADNPITLDSPPLLGTISVESAAGEATADSQTYTVTASVIRVPQATEIICRGENAVCSVAAMPIAADGDVTFNVEVFGRAELKVIRRDTGESYSLILNSKTVEPPKNNNTNNNTGNLDSALFGTWSFTDSEGENYYWKFNSNGTCIQGLPSGEYQWEWTIENGSLKLFEGAGLPAYKQYKIEGNLLYFWVDQVEDWSFPFTKE